MGNLDLMASLDAQLFIAHCEETAKKSLKNELKSNENVTLLIGPEGDFSVKEIKQAIDNKFFPVSLGTTRLRTETAAITVLSLLQAIGGDL